jgi:hypothetical protein
VSHVDDRSVLQGRLTVVRYNNEPQFFVADAPVFLELAADVLEHLAPHLDAEGAEADVIARLRDAVAQVERKIAARQRA